MNQIWTQLHNYTNKPILLKSVLYVCKIKGKLEKKIAIKYQEDPKARTCKHQSQGSLQFPIGSDHWSSSSGSDLRALRRSDETETLGQKSKFLNTGPQKMASFLLSELSSSLSRSAFFKEAGPYGQKRVEHGVYTSSRECDWVCS